MSPPAPRLRLEALDDRAAPAVLTVTTTADVVAADGVVSLREAIVAANTNAPSGDAPAGSGVDTIAFAIPGFGPGQPVNIGVTSELPEITETVIIDGFTQPNSSPAGATYFAPVGISGAAAGDGADGLTLFNHFGTQLRGLNFFLFDGNGLTIQGGGGHRVDLNHFGTDAVSGAGLGNGGDGVFIDADSSGNVIGNAVGGDDAADVGNEIAGNAGNGVRADGINNVISFNYIGLRFIDGSALPNGANGVLLNGSYNVLFGYNDSGFLQVISGNLGDGVRVAGDNNDIEVNVIGLAGDNATPLGNGGNGVTVLDGAEGNLVGLTALAFGNVISANAGAGVLVEGDNNAVLGNFIGTDYTGTVAVGNGGDGVAVSGDNNLVLGTADSDGRQVVAGNAGVGVRVTGIGNAVGGNRIGLSAGFAPLFNGGGAVALAGAVGTAFEGNLVRGGAPAVPLSAVGAGPGGTPAVNVYNADGSLRFSFLAFEPGFPGGVRVATGDYNGDGTDDIFVGAGVGGGPRVRVFSGADLAELANFFPYESTFTGGVYVAAGDITGDGLADVVTGTGVGGGPRIVAFSAADQSVVANFFAFEESFRGGVTVGSADLTNDGVAEVIAGTGPGGGPRVTIFAAAPFAALSSYFAYDGAFRGGVFVAGVPGLGVATAPGDGAASVKLFGGIGPVAAFTAPVFAGETGGATVAGAADASGLPQILAGSGAGGSVVRLSATGVAGEVVSVFNDPLIDGVFVG